MSTLRLSAPEFWPSPPVLTTTVQLSARAIERAAAPGSPMSHCVLLAVLLHLWLLLLVGNVPAGSALPGEGVWGAINVRLSGAGSDPAADTQPQAPPALPSGPVGAAATPRWGGSVRDSTPAEQAEPGAARLGDWAPGAPPLGERDLLPAATAPMPRQAAPDAPVAAPVPPGQVAESVIAPATLAAEPLPRLAPGPGMARGAALSGPLAPLPAPAALGPVGTAVPLPSLVPLTPNLHAAPLPPAARSAPLPLSTPAPAAALPAPPSLPPGLEPTRALPMLSGGASPLPGLVPLARPAPAVPTPWPVLPATPALAPMNAPPAAPVTLPPALPPSASPSAPPSLAPSLPSSLPTSPPPSLPVAAAPPVPVPTAAPVLPALPSPSLMSTPPAPAAETAAAPATATPSLAAAVPASSPATPPATLTSAPQAPTPAPVTTSSPPSPPAALPAVTRPAINAPTVSGAGRGASDAGTQLGQDVATPAAAPASAPRLNLNLPRSRGGPLSSLGSVGVMQLLPRPPEQKTKLAIEIELSGKADCRTAYSGLGPLAVVPLALDALKKDGGCKW